MKNQNWIWIIGAVLIIILLFQGGDTFSILSEYRDTLEDCNYIRDQRIAQNFDCTACTQISTGAYKTSCDCKDGYTYSGGQCVAGGNECDPATFDNYCADSENVLWCDSGYISNYDCLLNGLEYRCVDGFCKSTATPTTIKCYKCDGTTLKSVSVTAVNPSCPSGYSTTKPTCTGGSECDPATFDNYCADSENVVWCNQGYLFNYDCLLNGPSYRCVDGACKSTAPQVTIYCYKCDNSNLLQISVTEINPSCPVGYSDSKPSTCTASPTTPTTCTEGWIKNTAYCKDGDVWQKYQKENCDKTDYQRYECESGVCEDGECGTSKQDTSGDTLFGDQDFEDEDIGEVDEGQFSDGFLVEGEEEIIPTPLWVPDELTGTIPLGNKEVSYFWILMGGIAVIFTFLIFKRRQ